MVVDTPRTLNADENFWIVRRALRGFLSVLVRPISRVCAGELTVGLVL